MWHRKEDTDILDIDLNGFKGEQLKLRIDNARILTISGERSLDDNNKWSRFCKQIKLAENIKVNDISFELNGGILSIVIPKKPEILSMSISLAPQVLQMGQPEMTTTTENAGVWRLEIDKNMVVEVGVVLVFLLLWFGVCMKCLYGK
ncbi:17.5 kDa class I heat shock protein-like [Ziziphus jujuba]|uniref:17.5 kDa class I heat shock protein-like n=1 Tax=Ziziphus jujuba TaxID=326968 RepID=A0A6P3ZS64_ZIZJJ|nr:17.5 kDa class I heat shock protein-like [Ziziphus jujuba]